MIVYSILFENFSNTLALLNYRVNEHGVKARRSFQRAKVLRMNKDVRGEKN